MFTPSHKTLHAVRMDYPHTRFQRTQIYGNLMYPGRSVKKYRKNKHHDLENKQMKTYSEFYEEAKTNYGKNTEGHLQTGPEFDLYSFCMWHQKPEQKGIFTFSEDYLNNVNTLSEHIKNTIEIKENQLVPSVLKSISSSIPVKEPISSLGVYSLRSSILSLIKTIHY